MRVAYVLSSPRAASHKLGQMILPQLEAGTHGVEVVGIFFFDDNTLGLQKGNPIGERLAKVAKEKGNATRAIGGAAKVVEATYEVPFLAHAAMEPMNCVVRLTTEGCELWYGTQMQSGDKGAIQKALQGDIAGRVANRIGVGAENIKLNMLYAGGSFGRRAAGASDYVLEAVSIAQAIDGRVPVKLVWTREDETRAGRFRPMFLHHVRGALDGDAGQLRGGLMFKIRELS